MLELRLLIVAIVFNVFLDSSSAEGNYFLSAAKNVPRIGRSNSKNSNIDEMGKFFMKASKSVPRIGRRNDNVELGQRLDKRGHLPIWYDIAERFEYQPELMATPEILEQMEMGDDPYAYDWDKIQAKGDDYKKQPASQYLM